MKVIKNKYFVVASTITSWKKDNLIERRLSYFADDSLFWKRIYVMYYNVFDHKYYINGCKMALKEIDRQWKNVDFWVKENLSKKSLLRDMIYSLHRFGVSFQEYFMFKFYNLNTLGRISFSNLKLHYGYSQLANLSSVRDLFEDKGKLYEKLKSFYKRDLLVVYDTQQENELSAFLARHSEFIYKPYKGHSGIGIKVFHSYSGGVIKQMLDSGPFVIEELIVQANEMAILHQQSINTVRLVTFVVDGEVHIVGGAVRMGLGKSNVDNAGSGGIFASLDIYGGFVNSMAVDCNGNHYSVHPDTHCKIVGFDIPQWREAIELVKEVALVIKSAVVVAWDLAYSTKGWLIVEGNDVGDDYLLQAPLNKGINDNYVKLFDQYFR